VSSDVASRPSGNDAFDRARSFLFRLREEEALDWFEIAASEADDAQIRASAAAYVAGLLLGAGRPWEVDVWAEVVRQNSARTDLGNLLEAAAKLQLDEVDAARELLAGVEDPRDPWFPASVTSARIVRAHVAYLDGHVEQATREVLDAFATDAFAPDVWDAFARLCAETEFDPAEVVSRLPDDQVLQVLAALRGSEAAGVSRIVELLWERNPGDPRVLALVPSFASKLDSLGALLWSARVRAAGLARLCPLAERAEDVRVGAPERARAAALAHASFADERARVALEQTVPHLDDDELASTLAEVWSIAGALTDSVVVGGATTPKRALVLAAGLFAGGATAEAYAVLVHGLSMDAAEDLTTEQVVASLPLPALEGLAHEAETRGEEDVAGMLEALAVVAADRSI
jgi:prepilin-type processing-associated H-X9-DG protein